MHYGSYEPRSRVSRGLVVSWFTCLRYVFCLPVPRSLKSDVHTATMRHPILFISKTWIVQSCLCTVTSRYPTGWVSTWPYRLSRCKTPTTNQLHEINFTIVWNIQPFLELCVSFYVGLILNWKVYIILSWKSKMTIHFNRSPYGYGFSCRHGIKSPPINHVINLFIHQSINYQERVINIGRNEV